MSTSQSPAPSRIALITGANRGIGLETCRQLLARGVRVVMAGRDERALQAARQKLGASEENAITVVMDITDVASIESARDQIADQVGAVDIVVNNAAILLHENAGVLDTPAEAFEQTFETNVFGAVEVCRAFVPAMVKRRYGRVVNVSSGAGQLENMSTYAPAYSMSKAALNAFTRILAATYRDAGVLVNSVDPGWVRTDMGGPSAPRSVEDGADTIVWLATLPDDGPTGGFFHDRAPVAW
jgi:NAD(P)-dependent dehydrogenase (short-subunit alcohol dehydrogenase family)